MATGQRAFPGSTGAVVSHAILGEHPIAPRTIRPDLPIKLEETILKALEKNRDDRCQTAAELRADLRRVRRDLPANVPRPAPSAPVPSVAPAPSASVAATAPPAPAVSTTAPGSSDAQLVVGLVKRHRLAVLAIVGIVGAIVAGAWFASRSAPAGTPTAPSTALQIEPLTLTGKTALGALSPDGKFVAYVHRDDEVPNLSLWVRQLATGSDMPVVPVVAGRSYLGVAVTPDGTFVDFVALQRGAYSGDIWRVPFLGGTPRQIAHGVWSATGWAPDGRHMAFVREDSSTATSIIIADADGGNERVLTTRHLPQSFYSVYWAERPIARPSWSSDGRSILATGLVRLPGGAARRNELVVIDAATGSEIRTVPLEKISLLDAAWLDESHALVNGIMAGKLASLVRVDLTTGLMTPVTQDLAEFRGVSLTPDHQAAVTTRLDTRTAIWVGDASGASMSEVVPDGPSRPGVVSLDSAGGVVYQAATTNGYGIYAIRPGERTPTLVADNGTRPAVTSDGRRIVFQRDNDKIGLYRVNADGSGLTQLVDGDATSAVIMRDQTVLFLSNRSGDQTIWSVPIAGGSPREILHRFIARNTLRVSSDGSRLHFLAGFADGSEKTVPMMCDLPDCTNPRAANLTGRVARWTPDNQNVAYADQANVWVRPIAGGAPHPLTTFTDKTISDFSFSPDGKRLAVTRSTTLADIVLIKGIR
jgi:Tol biopolymer transport system component